MAHEWSFLGLVFDTGLRVTLFMDHLGCLASHWSVPVSIPPQVPVSIKVPSSDTTMRVLTLQSLTVHRHTFFGEKKEMEWAVHPSRTSLFHTEGSVTLSSMRAYMARQ